MPRHEMERDSGEPGPRDDALERLFASPAVRHHALTYLRGLTSPLERKSIVPIARSVGDGRVSALQKFINAGAWRSEEVFREVQRRLAERAGGPVTAVLVEHGFAKKGPGSVGVERQSNPSTSRRENCQVGSFLVGHAAGAAALLAGSLYLPPDWCGASEPQRARRERVHVPLGTRYRTRAQTACGLVALAQSWGQVGVGWVTFAGPVAAGEYLDELESLGVSYAIPVRPSEVVVPAALHPDRNAPPLVAATVADAAARVADTDWRHAPNRPAVEEYAAARVWVPRDDALGTPVWLHVRRVAGLDDVRLDYHLSNTGPDAPVTAPDDLREARLRTTRLLEEADQLLGLAHYETRSWPGWHHHMSLVALAHWLVTEGRRVPTGGTAPG